MSHDFRIICAYNIYLCCTMYNAHGFIRIGFDLQCISSFSSAEEKKHRTMIRIAINANAIAVAKWCWLMFTRLITMPKWNGKRKTQFYYFHSAMYYLWFSLDWFNISVLCVWCVGWFFVPHFCSNAMIWLSLSVSDSQHIVSVCAVQSLAMMMRLILLRLKHFFYGKETKIKTKRATFIGR